MSGFVHYHGKVREVPVNQYKNLEQVCRYILEDRGLEIPSHYNNDSFVENFKEFVIDELYDKYLFAGDRLFEIIEKSEHWENQFQATKEDDGTINFNVKYNNGGMGFDDAIEEAIKLIENESES